MSVSKSAATPKKTITLSKMASDKNPAAKKMSATKAAPAKAASAKPSAAKVAAPKADKTAIPVPTKGKAAKRNGATPITPEQRYRMICDAAYFRAERRGFIGGNSAEDWTAAEAEIDGLLMSIQK